MCPYFFPLYFEKTINDYCYAGEEAKHWGMACQLEDDVIQIGDEVLGYIDFICIDIGHIPGYRYIWSPRYIPVKIITQLETL